MQRRLYNTGLVDSVVQGLCRVSSTPLFAFLTCGFSQVQPLMIEPRVTSGGLTVIEELLAEEEQAAAKAVAKKTKKQRQKARKQQQQQQLEEEAEERKQLEEEEEERKQLLEEEAKQQLLEQERQQQLFADTQAQEQQQQQQQRLEWQAQQAQQAQHGQQQQPHKQAEQQAQTQQQQQRNGSQQRTSSHELRGSAVQAAAASLAALGLSEPMASADNHCAAHDAVAASTDTADTAANFEQQPPPLQSEPSNGDSFLHELFCCPLTKVSGNTASCTETTCHVQHGTGSMRSCKQEMSLEVQLFQCLDGGEGQSNRSCYSWLLSDRLPENCC